MGSSVGCNRVTMLLNDDWHTGRLWVAGMVCNRVTMLLTDDGHTGGLWVAGSSETVNLAQDASLAWWTSLHTPNRAVTLCAYRIGTKDWWKTDT